MASVTLQVLDGADRGVVYSELPTPITIGREEGNAIQLNDDRISRFHVKIQEDQGKIVLTDLESTNGTRVNGKLTQLRILQFGDLIVVGRSTLLYGSREQIAGKVDHLRSNGLGTDAPAISERTTGPADSDASISIDVDWSDSQSFPGTLLHMEPPDLPKGLSPAQAAQLAEMIEYLHARSNTLLDGVEIEEESDSVAIDRERWQELLDVQGLLAQYVRKIGGTENE